MPNLDIFAAFLKKFPAYHWQITYWQPMEQDVIRVGLRDGTEVWFRYQSEDDWRMETRKVYTPSLNGA